MGQQAPSEHHASRRNRFRRMQAEDDLREHGLRDPDRPIVDRYRAAGRRRAWPVSEDSFEATRKSPPLTSSHQLRFSQGQCAVAGSSHPTCDPAIEPGAFEQRAHTQEKPARHGRREGRARRHARSRPKHSGVRHPLIVGL
jgi:hypothetical protein